MSLQELWHRSFIAVRDRVAPRSYLRWDISRVLSETGVVALPKNQPITPHDSYLPWIEEAKGLLSGEFSFFGKTVSLSDPPNWRANAWTGEEWPDIPSHDVPYRRSDVAGGVKYAWEIGRLTMLTSLALAANPSEPLYRQTCLQWVNDFALKNPILHGVHHTSGIEMGVRNLVLVHVLRILGDVEADEIQPSLALALQQAWYCRDHLSLGSSANNHLLAEYAGMAAVASLFPSQASMFEQAVTGLEEQTVKQFSSDGISLEQSFGYVPFIWELIIYPLNLAVERGRTIQQEALTTLSKSLEAARWMRLETGNLPQVGDEDDGRVLLPADACSRLDLVGNALATFLDLPVLSEEPNSDALSRLLYRRCSKRPKVNHFFEKKSDNLKKSRDFPLGGYTVWRESGLLAQLDHGPLGLGSLAAHGHADCLSIVIANGKDLISVDPGIYAYQEDPVGRDRFRGTPYHSTVLFGVGNQSEILGPFIWGKRADVAQQGDGWECSWFTGEKHWRSVEVEEGLVLIRDRVNSVGGKLNFVLHPEANVTIEGVRATVRVGSTTATFVVEGTSAWQTVEGEYSKRLGHKQPTLRLQAELTGYEAETRIEIQSLDS